MRKVLHSPGPWQWYFKIDDNLEADCGVYYEERPGMVYAICRAPRYEGEQQWKANARLIAAAPELLEALKECKKVLAVENSLRDNYGWDIFIAEYINPVIKKAEGGK